jgi:heme exporter protein A
VRVSAAGLAATRGGRAIFSDIAFSAGDGDLLVVTGPNGAGKSTLLRLIAGLLRPAAGTIVVDPLPEEGLGGAVHYFGHLDALKPGLPVSANLAFWQRLQKGGGAVADALDSVGLGGLDVLPVAVLSAGQKRRAALARLLLSSRPVWLLDEPLTALDAAGEAMLGRLIADHRAGGGIVIAATHRALPAEPTATLSLAERA